MTKKTPEKPSRYFSKEEKARIAGERLAKRAQAAKKKVKHNILEEHDIDERLAKKKGKSAVEEGSGESILPVVAKFPKKGLPIKTGEGEVVTISAAEFAHLARCVSHGYAAWGDSHKQHVNLESAGLIRYNRAGHYWEPTDLGRKFVVNSAAGVELKKVSEKKKAKKESKAGGRALSDQQKDYLAHATRKNIYGGPANKHLLDMSRKGLLKYVKSSNSWKITSEGKVLHQSLKILANIEAVKKVMYEDREPIAVQQGTTSKTTLSDAKKELECKVWVVTLKRGVSLEYLRSFQNKLFPERIKFIWLDLHSSMGVVMKIALRLDKKQANTVFKNGQVTTVTLLDKPPAHAIPWNRE